MRFCSTSNENGHFSSENGETPKLVVDFLKDRRHIPKQKHGNRRGFRRKKLQQQRQTPWKSSRILRVKPNFFILHFSFFIIFFIFLHFSFVFLLFLYVSSFFFFLVARNPIFCGAQLLQDFL